MKFKENRAISFVAVGIVYILAILAGYFTYLYLPAEWADLVLLKLFIADTVSTVVVFLFSLIFKNASVYDPYWSVQPLVILWLFAFKYSLSTASVIVMLVAVTLWGVRLTANWAYTFKSLNHQDWRYTMLKETTGKLYPFVNFFGIHLVPTLIVLACVAPALYVVLYLPRLNVGAIVFYALSLGAVLLQGTADVQMHRFRKNPHATFIRNGVWKYSRHPNYLAEIVMWWGIGLATVCMLPSLWITLLGALLNTLLFLFVSIPMADKKQSKKEGYADYKKQTFMLLPLPKIQKQE